MVVRSGLLLALLLLVGVLPATAQECSIAAYSDAAGTSSSGWPDDVFDELVGVSFFVVLFAEDTANAAAYKLELEGFDTGWFFQERVLGPGGNGLYLDEDPAGIGTNVALGECAFGFSGLPILIEEYRYLAFRWQIGNETVELSANTNQHPDLPLYVNCASQKKPCTPGPTLVFSFIDPVGAASFSKVKGLFR